MKVTLGFSPCPNDTFIFDALVNNKIDAGGLQFDVILEDIETLNQWAFEGKLDITKLSFPAFFHNPDKYILLNSGAALGKGVGPLLISKTKELKSKIEDLSICLPGKNTTANLLFSFAFPGAKNKSFARFNHIEDFVLRGETDLGVIIHENRFTYLKRGLNKVMDLGEYWENKMKVPIPLGGIAIKRKIIHGQCTNIEKLIGKSLEYARSNYPVISDYVKSHAQEMDEQVMRQHIELYVNDFSQNLGKEGRNAIDVLFSVYKKENGSKISQSSSSIFLS